MDKLAIRGRGSPGEVFRAFLKLGATSFGGPVAHLGYFRDELVTRRKWLDEAEYADLVALCQFLPGPASSQVGFALGLMRAGPLGAFAAWAGFTAPSAILLILFALGSASLDGPLAQGALHGLKLVAVAVVAQAVFGMARSLVTDGVRATILVLAVMVVVLVGGPIGQVGAIVVGAALGSMLLKIDVRVDGLGRLATLPGRTGIWALCVFALLLVGLPLVADGKGALQLFDAFYRAGALVFGGGHVVLPLLDAETVGRAWMTPDVFLAGYGAAQAVPGPLFTFAAYLGAVVEGPPNGIGGALIALVGIFLPGMLLLVGVLPFWDQWRNQRIARSAMAGANAAVVGLLGLALYDPVFTSAVMTPLDFALALAGFVALVAWRVAPWMVVVALAAAGSLIGVWA